MVARQEEALLVPVAREMVEGLEAVPGHLVEVPGRHDGRNTAVRLGAGRKRQAHRVELFCLAEAPEKQGRVPRVTVETHVTRAKGIHDDDDDVPTIALRGGRMVARLRQVVQRGLALQAHEGRRRRPAEEIRHRLADPLPGAGVSPPGQRQEHSPNVSAGAATSARGNSAAALTRCHERRWYTG